MRHGYDSRATQAGADRLLASRGSFLAPGGLSVRGPGVRPKNIKRGLIAGGAANPLWTLPRSCMAWFTRCVAVEPCADSNRPYGHLKTFTVWRKA